MGANVSCSTGATELIEPGRIDGSNCAGAIVGTVTLTVVGSRVFTTGTTVEIIVGSITGTEVGASTGKEVGSTMFAMDGDKVI